MQDGTFYCFEYFDLMEWYPPVASLCSKCKICQNWNELPVSPQAVLMVEQSVCRFLTKDTFHWENTRYHLQFETFQPCTWILLFPHTSWTFSPWLSIKTVLLKIIWVWSEQVWTGLTNGGVNTLSCCLRLGPTFNESLCHCRQKTVWCGINSINHHMYRADTHLNVLGGSCQYNTFIDIAGN